MSTVTVLFSSIQKSMFLGAIDVFCNFIFTWFWYWNGYTIINFSFESKYDYTLSLLKKQQLSLSKDVSVFLRVLYCSHVDHDFGVGRLLGKKKDNFYHSGLEQI